MNARPLGLDLHEALNALLSGRDLDEDQADALLVALASGRVPDALAGGLLVALRQKGETAAEVRGLARAMRRLARDPEVPGDAPLVDVVGTGGDGSGSLNLSTGAALLAAACGCRVVKHGNRAVSSRAGSADVLEALGLDLHRSAEAQLAGAGFAFLFAPAYHPAMGAIVPVRRALGVRTVFNVLGPLTNPAAPGYLVVGAYSAPLARLMAEALSGLPLIRAFVVHGALGWDEPTPVGPFLRLEVRPGKVREATIDPLDHGVPRCGPEGLAGGGVELNAARLRAVLTGERGAARDAITLGAGLVLELTGRAATLSEGIAAAGAAIDDGRAGAVLTGLSHPLALDGGARG